MVESPPIIHPKRPTRHNSTQQEVAVSQKRSQLCALLALALAWQVIFNLPLAAKSATDSPSSPPAASPAATLRAASGATIAFVTQNGETVDNLPPQTLELPHLVLYRNGALTDASERTLLVEVSGIEVPSTGVTVTLELETQHTNSDSDQDPGQRISVWRASRRIANTAGVTQTGDTAVFRHEFGETVPSNAGTIATPTDYFRYDITVVDANHPPADPRHAFSADYAFLLENQWVAPLPPVQEESAGAAPDELNVYYTDMLPFKRIPHDATTRLPRENVTAYVCTELVPGMIEAFRLQTDEWGFPWYQAWTSYRSEDAERLSVALTDGQTWFHGRAPATGHSGISINVTGGTNVGYDTLTDGLMSTFHHELFHNIQRNINLHSGGDGRVDGAGDAWQFFSEGTAVLAASVGEPHGQFTESLQARNYMFYANSFVQRGGGRVRDLNTSYKEMDPYKAAIYWRFLYEQCGGMQVISRTLTALYAGDVVDISSSRDLVGGAPAIIDRALAGSSCPFQTHGESLVAFARAIYGLQLDGGRCMAPGAPAGCGFYDPYGQYRIPPVSTLAFGGAGQTYRDGIRSSFGIDLVEVTLDPATDGRPLTLEFVATSGLGVEFGVQVVPLADSGEGSAPLRIPDGATATEVLRVTADRQRLYRIPAVHTASCNRLGLIITRLDAGEASGTLGEYAIVLRAPSGESTTAM
jgi:hypothetical protein